MKTIAVIAEFNPFHNGHAWFLAEARRHAGADFVTVLMSGDFVQRGAPAVLDKYSRTSLALAGGADLVLELPVSCAASGARRFAEGACAVLNGLGTVDELWFGSEEGEISSFLDTTDLLADESDSFSAALQEQMAAGLTFPAARAAALSLTAKRPGLSALLSKPNNILGLEYCLALQRSGSPIRPKTLPRQGSGYHDTDLASPAASATAIRQALESCRAADTAGAVIFDRQRAEQLLGEQIPSACLSELHRALRNSVPLCADDFSSMLHYQLLRETRSSMTAYLDVSADLAARITHLLPVFRSWTSFAADLKTRNITRTQTDRALLHILLGITEESLRQALHPSCVRMLGFRSTAAPLLSEIKKRSSLTLVSGASAMQQYGTDLFASHLYEARSAVLSGRTFIHENSRQVIRI